MLVKRYQAAEEYEKDGANELTGFYEVDKPVIEALKTNITKGIALNERNLAAVSRPENLCMNQPLLMILDRLFRNVTSPWFSRQLMSRDRSLVVSML